MNFVEQALMRGTFQCRVMQQGIVIAAWTDHNLIVNAGRDGMARLLSGNRTDAVTQIAFGTNGTPAAVDDTELEDAFVKNLQAVRHGGYSGTWYGEAVTVNPAQVRFEWFLNTTEANGLNIREFGLLFDDDVLFARHLRDPLGITPDVIVKQNDMTLAGAWTINFGG